MDFGILFKKINIKLVLRIFLGAVFLVSGISKLIGPENFIKEVDKINFLFSFLTIPAAYSFMLLELILGILLIFKFNKKVLVSTTAVVAVLCCYLGFKIITHDTSDCGCFGNFLYRSNMSALIQDLFLLIIAVYLYE